MITEFWILMLAVITCLFGGIFAIYQYVQVRSIRMAKISKSEKKKVEEELEEKGERKDISEVTFAQEENDKLVEVGENIYSCAIVYILEEYLFLFGFLMFFGLLIYVFLIL